MLGQRNTTQISGAAAVRVYQPRKPASSTHEGNMNAEESHARQVLSCHWALHTCSRVLLGMMIIAKCVLALRSNTCSAGRSIVDNAVVAFQV